MTSLWALTWCLCTNSFCSSCGRRASTAIVCKNWAALHENCSSGIWEAVNLSGVTPPGDGTPCRAALEAWLARRAPGLRQLQLQDTTTPSFDNIPGGRYDSLSRADEVRMRFTAQQEVCRLRP